MIEKARVSALAFSLRGLARPGHPRGSFVPKNGTQS
jgi:hypothetical protein